MKIKKCSICLTLKDLDEFHKRKSSKDGRTNNCKVCQSEYIKGHYQRDKKYYVGKATARQAELVKLYHALKDNKPCADCGVVHRYFALDYDHRDPSKKLGDISLLRFYGKQTLLDEIAKCDLVCATCHRYRTFRKLNVPS